MQIVRSCLYGVASSRGTVVWCGCGEDWCALSIDNGESDARESSFKKHGAH